MDVGASDPIPSFSDTAWKCYGPRPLPTNAPTDESIDPAASVLVGKLPRAAGERAGVEAAGIGGGVDSDDRELVTTLCQKSRHDFHALPADAPRTGLGANFLIVQVPPREPSAVLVEALFT